MAGCTGGVTRLNDNSRCRRACSSMMCLNENSHCRRACSGDWDGYQGEGTTQAGTSLRFHH